jgi:hypothetical protein
MVCEGQCGLAEELAGLAKEAPALWAPGLFMKLGEVVMAVGCEDLGDALVEAFGPDWMGLYHDLHRLDGFGDDLRRQLDRLRESYGERWPWRAD